MSTLQAAMDRNMAAYWAPYGRGADCERHEEGGTVWLYTGVATPLFNGVFNPSLDAAGVHAVVKALAERIARRGATAFWWIGPGAKPGDIGALLEQQGVKAVGSVPGMVAQLATIDDREASIEGFEIRKVEGTEMRALWGRIAAIGTGFSEQAVAQMERSSHDRRPALCGTDALPRLSRRRARRLLRARPRSKASRASTRSPRSPKRESAVSAAR
jgi:hypothetical protein